MILGIDVSTSCTGFALIDNNGKLIEASFSNLKNEEDLFDKAEIVKKEIRRYFETYKLIGIAIEQNLSIFRRGLSTAHTLATLARFNGIVCYLSYNVTGMKPSIISVLDARKSVGIRNVKKGEDAKKIVKEWVDLQESTFKWPTKILRNGPRKGFEVLEDGVEDAMDAYVMARAFLVLKK
jgi:Holliday junction resolvasome RuvABC endonuclease subunit